MKYRGMPLGMWLLFRRSFREKLVDVLGYIVGGVVGCEELHAVAGVGV